MGMTKSRWKIKMPGDHPDGCMLQRTLLRRQARNVERVEDKTPWDGEEPSGQ